MDPDKATCIRCGIVRTIRPSSERTGYCRECKQGYADKPRPDRGWMDDAACTQVDPELFFPASEDDWQPTREAKRVCASCPVRDLCLADAPVWDRWSIRGGRTATERRRKAVA